MKPITIREPNAPEEPSYASTKLAEAEAAAEEDFYVHPAHDTGSVWYKILSFLLPILGLIAMVVFNHFRHTRNAKACRNGAIAGLIFLAVVLALFLLLIVLAVV